MWLNAVPCGLQHVDLMLREIADGELGRPRHGAVLRRQQVRQQLGEGGLAVAVCAEERDPFTRIDAQVQAAQHGTARLITDRNACEAHQGRCERNRLGECQVGRPLIGSNRFVGDLCERLDAALRLTRLARVVAEAVDEALELAPLRVDARLARLRRGHTLGMGSREARVVAGIEGEASTRHVEDALRHGIEQRSVMAHHDERPGIALQVSFQPGGRFEIEVVGRLVQQQQVGLDEERGGERDPHAPAAGELRQRHLLHRLADAETGEQARGPRRRRVRADLCEPALDLDAPRTLGVLCFGDQGRTFLVRRKHGSARRLRPARNLLIRQPDGKAAGADDRTRVGLESSRDEA